MIWTGLPSGSRKVANAREPLDLADVVVERRRRAPRASSASRRDRRPEAPRCRSRDGSSSVPCSANRTGPAVQLGPLVAVATHQREADDVGVERDRATHVAGPVVDVVDDHGPDATHPPGLARGGSALAEDLRLLRLELVLGQHPVGAQLGQTLELGRRARRARRRRRGAGGAEDGAGAASAGDAARSPWYMRFLFISPWW